MTLIIILNFESKKIKRVTQAIKALFGWGSGFEEMNMKEFEWIVRGW